MAISLYIYLYGYNAVLYFSNVLVTDECLNDVSCKKLFAYHKLIKTKMSTAGTRSSPLIC